MSANSQSEGAATSSPSAEAPEQKVDSILIVDDDEITSRLYLDFFSKVGFQVTVAHDGPTAVGILKDFRPSLVLLDIFLPGMNGVEVLKYIRSRRNIYDVPVIMFSSSSTTRHVDGAWRAGATKCLAKDDFDPYQLLKVIRTVLADEKANESLREVAVAVEQGEKTPYTTGSISLDSLERENREAFLEELADLRTRLRKWWQEFINSDQDRSARPKLYELMRALHAVAEHAHKARLRRFTLFGRVFQVMLNELYQRPHQINASTLRTASEAIDLLHVLLETPIQHLAQSPLPGLVLAIDKQISPRHLVSPFREANLNLVACRDFEVAMDLAVENRFHLILVDGTLLSEGRPERWDELTSGPPERATPVVLSLNQVELEQRSSSVVEGGHGLIGRPWVVPEATLKALSYVLRGQLADYHEASMKRSATAGT